MHAHMFIQKCMACVRRFSCILSSVVVVFIEQKREREREREKRGGGRERQVVYCLQSLLLVSLTLIESIKLLKL